MWTDERVDLLQQLWLRGVSASKIAADLGGVTRSAVIGKVHRLGLEGRTMTSRTKPPRPQRTSSKLRKSQRAQALRVPPPSTLNAPTPLPPARADDVARVAFQDLDEQKHCRWVCAEHVNNETPQYCGGDRVRGPYCAGHAARAYVESR
jgi:GcrA cell cycle regulator